MSLIVDERDVRFVLFDQLDIGELTKTEAFKEHSDEVFQMVLTEAHRLAENVLAYDDSIDQLRKGLGLAES